ncbi:MAG: hypothetical protein QOE75_1185 [Solirubrobacterales bacterium]|jgi:prevent-host-death family protein|nr:hypothetical protein [Solirubrobacterales bacterium]HWC08468.1 type II toxin-antitoxin system prevent-host-death family antitoxin [Solirubrobacterales bacterium]
MPTIPQKEIRNNVGEILRRAEAGEEFTITVSGRPVARLGPLGQEPSSWVDSAELADVFALPADPDFMKDIEEGFREDWLRDPWEEAERAAREGGT